MRLLFLGSPAFAVPALRALHGAGHCVELVVTRPDRPRGRSGRPAPTAVKEAAVELGLDVFQPESANAPDAAETLRKAGAELGVVVAYGEILSPAVLDATAQGFINVHASLLPNYRGAAPVNWALMRGETRTGVSVIRMEPKLDAGPILAQRQMAIGEDENAGELADRLAALGADAVADVVNRLAAGEELPGRPQPRRGGFLARKLTKADGRVDWSFSAEEIHNRVRGLTPWPGAYCDLQTEGRSHRVSLLGTARTRGTAERQHHEPGTVIRVDKDGILVETGGGPITVTRLKPSGGRAMDAADFVRGHRIRPGDRFC